MGIYSKRILPVLLKHIMGHEGLTPYRRELLAPLSGRVLELGAGPGYNLPHYPLAVTEVTLLEIEEVFFEMAQKQEHSVPVRFALLESERYPFEDESFDAVVCSWTLCSIEDLPAALAEVKRVLRPGGSFHFVEHGLSEKPLVASWQHRLTPLQRRIGGGCHLNRDFFGLIEKAGFFLDRQERRYDGLAFSLINPFYFGVAKRQS